MTLLTQDDVNDAVCRFLSDHGWTVLSRRRANERGSATRAEQAGRGLVVEPKGEGSSQRGTSRYGRTFTRSQVTTHVAVGILNVLRVVSGGRQRAALALPDDPNHRDTVAPVRPALDRLGVGVFWVAADRGVRLDAPWDL